MDNGAPFDSSFYDTGQPGFRSNRCKQSSSLLQSTNIRSTFATVSQLVGEDPSGLRCLPPPSGLFGVAHPLLIHNGPRTFESEFHIMDCDGTAGAGALFPTRHRDSVSSSSASSFSAPASPGDLLESTSNRGPDGSLSDLTGDPDDGPWNLVAYHIPWGSTYEGYKAGTLPGPDGPCIFLRSPTPSKKQRTSQACEKCRERKAKCSGSRPSCARCEARGHVCVYTPVVLANCHENSLRTNRPDHSRSSGTSQDRMLRKDSLPDSVSSISSGGTRERSPCIEDGFASDSLQSESIVGTGRQREQVSWSPSISGSSIPPLLNSIQSSSTTPTILPREAHQRIPDCPAPFRGSTHAFSSIDVDLLYADSRSGLDAYRFPPPTSSLEGVKAAALVHPQPQSVGGESLPQLPHARSGNEAAFGNVAWLSGQMDRVWREESSVPGLDMDVECSEPPSAASTNSISPSPASYSGSVAHRNTPLTSYCGVAPQDAFYDESVYTVTAYPGPFNIKDAYNVGWTLPEES